MLPVSTQVSHLATPRPQFSHLKNGDAEIVAIKRWSCHFKTILHIHMFRLEKNKYDKNKSKIIIICFIL